MIGLEDKLERDITQVYVMAWRNGCTYEVYVRGCTYIELRHDQVGAVN